MFSNLIKQEKKKSVLNSKYRNTHTLDQRRLESGRIRHKYHDRIPVICEVLDNSQWALTLDRNKYLVPTDLTVGQFFMVLRKRMKLGAEQGIFLFDDNGTLPACSQLMSILYQSSKNEDGFLYLGVAVENTFG